MYYLIYQKETDGEIIIKSLRTQDEVHKFITTISLYPEDYSLIEGTILKDFNNKTFNLEILKGKHY